MASRTSKTVLERTLEKQDRSIAWLSRRVPVSVSYAWMMIRGEREMTAAFRAAASEALGVPEDILFPAEAPDAAPAEAAS